MLSCLAYLYCLLRQLDCLGLVIYSVFVSLQASSEIQGYVSQHIFREINRNKPKCDDCSSFTVTTDIAVSQTDLVSCVIVFKQCYNLPAKIFQSFPVQNESSVKSFETDEKEYSLE